VKRLLLSMLALIASSTMTWGQPTLIGTWELTQTDVNGTEEVFVWQFREDGILIKNEYREGDLKFVFVITYAVDDAWLEIDRGSSWALNPETGELESFEGFSDGAVASRAIHDVFETYFFTSLDINQAAHILIGEMEKLGLDRAEFLGADLDPEDEAFEADNELMVRLVKFSA